MFIRIWENRYRDHSYEKGKKGFINTDVTKDIQKSVMEHHICERPSPLHQAAHADWEMFLLLTCICEPVNNFSVKNWNAKLIRYVVVYYICNSSFGKLKLNYVQQLVTDNENSQLNKGFSKQRVKFVTERTKYINMTKLFNLVTVLMIVMSACNSAFLFLPWVKIDSFLILEHTDYVMPGEVEKVFLHMFPQECFSLEW